MKQLLATLLFILCPAAWGLDAVREHTGVTLSEVRVIDADTIEADLHFGWNLVWRGRIVRIAGYDAWEIRHGKGTTEEHVEKGRIAAAEFQAMFDAAEYAIVIPDGDGGFSRERGWLRWVMDDGSIVKAEEWAEENGHVKHD